MNTLTFERPPQTAVTATVESLRASYGERTVTTQAVREHHSHGEGMQDAGLPDVVVFPETNEEIASILKLCNQARIPVIAYGTGTSLEGHLKALYGGVCVDLSRMAKVLEINAEDLDCRVQAGVTREQLNADIRHTGLFFPIDPGANASIGGEGLIKISSSDPAQIEAARAMILGIVEEAEVGKVYDGKVVNMVDFGAFVNFMGGKDGLVHVSEIRNERTEKVSDVLSEGQAVKVKVLEIDQRGKVRLSMRVVDQETGAELEDTRPPREERPRGDRPDRGPRRDGAGRDGEGRGDRGPRRDGGGRDGGGGRGEGRGPRGDRPSRDGGNEGGDPNFVPAFLKDD